MPRLHLDEVLVVALHEQRPEQDPSVIETIQEKIERYYDRLAKVSKPLTSSFEEREIDIPLYRPTTALLWGPYDHATLYLADDLESISAVASGNGALSEEFIFGSPFVSEADGEVSDRALRQLFDESERKDKPLIALSRLKLGDHLVSLLGSRLNEAVADWIYREALKPPKDVLALALRCWSWPELAVILMSSSAKSLVRFAGRIERLTLEQLDSSEPTWDELDRGLRHAKGAQVLQCWACGIEDLRERPMRTENDRRKLKKAAKEINVVVSSRTQLGILREAWKTLAAGKLEDDHDLLRAGNCAFGLEETRNEPLSAAESSDVLQKTLQYLHADDRTDLFTARVRVQPKPGHLLQVLDSLDNQSGNHHVDQRVEFTDRGQSVAVTVHVPPSDKGFLNLLCFSHCLRVGAETKDQLMETSTTLEYSTDVAAASEPTPEPGNARGRRGYNLLYYLPSKHLVEYEQTRFRAIRFGRVESLSLATWYRAVAQVTNRPEMYGAMMELYGTAKAVYDEVLYIDDQQLSPGHHTSAKVSGRDLASAIRLSAREIMGEGQLAYHQRLQFSPVHGGAPPLNGQVAFGINQIVRTLDGLIATIMQAGLQDPSQRSALDSPARKALVTIGDGPAIETRAIMRFAVFHLGLNQATTPLALCLLFHELGHVIIRNWLWDRSRTNYPRYMDQRDKWRTLLEKTETKLLRRTSLGGLEGRVEVFLEDVFAHATWRRIGCAGDFRLFRTQFLATHAMGLRTNMETSAVAAFEAWAGVLAHLMVQKALAESEELPRRAFGHLHERLDRPTSQLLETDFFRELFSDVFRYCEAELVHYVSADHLFTPGDDDSSVEPRHFAMDRLVDVFRGIWLGNRGRGPLVRLGKAGNKRKTRYTKRLDELFGVLTRLENRLAIARAALERDEFYRGIDENLRQGKGLVARLGDLVSDEGCPTDAALVWVREILLSSTRYFEEETRGQRTLGLERDAGLNVRGKPRGLYADFLGGLFVSGDSVRRDYLKARLAALQSLSHVADRAMLGPIWGRLTRQREFKRIELRRAPKGRKSKKGCYRVQIRRNDAVAEGELRDLSPMGICFLDATMNLQENDEFEVEGHDDWVKCEVKWTGNAGVGAQTSEGPEERMPWAKMY